MKLSWEWKAWKTYLLFQDDSKTLRRINTVIKEVYRAGTSGKPPAKAELLRGGRPGLRSVRIDKKNRLVYFWAADVLTIIECGNHHSPTGIC